MNKKKKRITIELIVGIILIAVVYFFVSARDKSVWPKDRVTADSGKRIVMGTFANVTAVTMTSDLADKCIKAAIKELEDVDALMSNYNDNSEVSKINKNAFDQPVKVSKPTFEVLQKAQKFSRLSKGAFDITVGPLIDLWHQAAEANSLPDGSELTATSSLVGYEKLILDADDMTVEFAVEDMKIDLGGIAKGYAIDKAVEAMQKCGAIGGMVDVGGDIRCFGAAPPGKNFWLIGLQDPGKIKTGSELAEEPLLVLKLTNSAVTTSGNYRRYASINGKKYSHIIDAQSGSSSEHLTSVTIIAPNAVDADALATAVTVMGAEKGVELIESLEKTEAILIPAETQKIIGTTGGQQYINSQQKALAVVTEIYEEKSLAKTYKVLKTETPPKLDGNWNGPIWCSIKPLEIKEFMGDEPEHKPKTRAKLLYDDEFIYVIFRVEDKFVKAVAQNYQDSVCVDSCAEFFFTPGIDISKGYFNIEINCGGTMLFKHQITRGVEVVPVSNSDCEKVRIFHSEPKIIDPEKQQPTTWIIEYRVPFEILDKYHPVTKPASGVIWRANFYKCADQTSHPHWLTWSIVDLPNPDFHQPVYFGNLIFE